MRARLTAIAVLALACSMHSEQSAAEDRRTQYPSFLANSYFEVGVGYIDYPFSARQLEPGFRVESIVVPHTAARLVLLGHRFNKHLAAQVSYMRPVEWVGYKDVNGVPAKRTVWMNLAGLTLRASLPLAGVLSLDGEAGLGIVTRRGFKIEGEDTAIVKDANYWSALLGGGLRYRLSDSWELGANALYSPPRASAKQPHTLLLSGGFRYNMRPLSEERVERNSRADFVFPRNLVQIGYASDAPGFGVNGFLSGGAVPIFWGGNAQVKRGAALFYQRNFFHTRKIFSLDLGASVAYWTSRVDQKTFYTASLFPVLRFTPVRTRPFDLYFDYSLAGPTSISRVSIDGNDTGSRFTFQDFMGVGIYAGKGRHVNAEIKIGHYSNGNLFPQNAGVSIPLSFNLGYAFH